MAKLLVWHAHSHSSLWSVTQTGGQEEGPVVAGGRESEGEGSEVGASVPTLNDSLGQPLLHMLSGASKARMQTQTNRSGGDEIKLIRR